MLYVKVEDEEIQQYYTGFMLLNMFAVVSEIIHFPYFQYNFLSLT